MRETYYFASDPVLDIILEECCNQCASDTVCETCHVDKAMKRIVKHITEQEGRK